MSTDQEIKFDLIADGLHPYLDERKYRRDPAIAVSDIKEMRLSPAHFYAKKFGGYRPEKSNAQNIGTLVHLACLEPEVFDSHVILDPVDAPKRPTKAQREAKKPSEETIKAIEFWDKWEKENAGKEVLSVDELAQIKGIRDSVFGHEDAMALLKDTQHEVAMFKTILVDGQEIRVKGKADIITRRDTIADIKTVDRGYANPRDFAKSIDKWGYEMQAAWYLDLFNAIEGKHVEDDFEIPKTKRRWVFIVAEKEPPFAVCTLELDQDSIEIGRRENEMYLRQLARCFSKNEWPGPPRERGLVGLPEWRKKA